jgi:ATP-dependent Clp protease ATP-binding subunit ClpA
MLDAASCAAGGKSVFERFNDDARRAVVLAQGEARRLRHGYIGTEHLLLGLLGKPTPASRVLQGLGIDFELVRSEVVRVVGEGPPVQRSDLDADALRAIGIDLDEVRRRAEEAFGPGALDVRRPRRWRNRRRRRCEPVASPFAGHIPFTPRAKRALELSLREAIHLRHAHIGAEHLLLGLARQGEGIAARVLATHGISERLLRAAVLRELGDGGWRGRSA